MIGLRNLSLSFLLPVFYSPFLTSFLPSFFPLSFSFFPFLFLSLSPLSLLSVRKRMSKGHRFLFRNPTWFRGHGRFSSFKHHLRKPSWIRSSRDVLQLVAPFVHGRTLGLKFSIKIKQRFALKTCTWGMQNVFPIKAFLDRAEEEGLLFLFIRAATKYWGVTVAVQFSPRGMGLLSASAFYWLKKLITKRTEILKLGWKNIWKWCFDVIIGGTLWLSPGSRLRPKKSTLGWQSRQTYMCVFIY